jgi:hypothetical protein
VPHDFVEEVGRFSFGENYLPQYSINQNFVTWVLLVIFSDNFEPMLYFCLGVHCMKRHAMVKNPLIFHQSQFFHMGFACEFFLLILNPCCVFASRDHCLKRRAMMKTL